MTAIDRSMAEPAGYRLLDAGDGERLEQLGDTRIRRPAPAALEPPRRPEWWMGALGMAVAGLGGAAEPATGAFTALPATIRLDGLVLELHATRAGAIGVFPEHAVAGRWVADAVGRRSGSRPPTVLSLFAATGLVTLMAARAGAAVTHVDASRTALAAARRNAAASGLADRPIRWLADDVIDFTRREARRERRYDVVVLDPPSFGRSAAGRATWSIERDLGWLLDVCRAVAAPDAAWCLTAHTTGWTPDRLRAALATAAGPAVHRIEALPLELTAQSGARLRLGAMAHVDPREPPNAEAPDRGTIRP